MKGKLNFDILENKRNELDITQKSIADELGISIDEYKQIEKNGKIPDKQILIKLCHILKLGINEVFDANYKNTKVISVMSNKGGVGKTSLTSSIAYALTELGNKVLCIDSDMQGNLTHSFNLETDPNKNLAIALKNEDDLEKYIIESEYENLDFVVYNSALSAIDMIMFTKNAREYILKRIMENIVKKGVYDYILIDTNPSLSILNFNVINACNYCIIPVQLGAFGLEGIGILLDFIDNAKKFNEDFKEYKLVINNYDARKGITAQSEEWLKENYGDNLFDAVIKVDTNIENAQVQSMPVLQYNSKSRIAKEIRILTKEIEKEFK